jgi:hypothetical protein
MGNLKQLSQRLSSLRGELNQILSDKLNAQEPLILDMNREQLLNSEDINEQLLPKYKPSTAKRKGKANYDLKEDGDFQGRMFSQAGKEKWLIGSNDWKASIYNEKEGYKIFGLQNDNMQLLKERITPDIHNRILKHLKRK